MLDKECMLLPLRFSVQYCKPIRPELPTLRKLSRTVIISATGQVLRWLIILTGNQGHHIPLHG